MPALHKMNNYVEEPAHEPQMVKVLARKKVREPEDFDDGGTYLYRARTRANVDPEVARKGLRKLFARDRCGHSSRLRVTFAAPGRAPKHAWMSAGLSEAEAIREAALKVSAPWRLAGPAVLEHLALNASTGKGIS